MTTIVAIRTEKEVVIGADRIAIGGGDFALNRSVEKIAIFGPWALALSGDHAHLDVAERNGESLAVATDERNFMERLRSAFDASRFTAIKPPEGESGWANYNCSGILARRACDDGAGAWYFTGDLRPYPLETGRPMGAGLGRECACAAALAALRCGSPVREAVVLGLQIAAEYLPQAGSRSDQASIVSWRPRVSEQSFPPGGFCFAEAECQRCPWRWIPPESTLWSEAWSMVNSTAQAHREATGHEVRARAAVHWIGTP